MEEFHLQNLDHCPDCGDTLTEARQESEHIFCEECEEEQRETFEL